jgi:hypothetical protein
MIVGIKRRAAAAGRMMDPAIHDSVPFQSYSLLQFSLFSPAGNTSLARLPRQRGNIDR